MENKNKMGNACPVAYIAKNKQREKQYGDIVYLKNGDEFSIELYNPTNNKVSARIELNNVSIGPGIILRPGERIFLERYVTEARKFLFETYKVNGDNKEVQKAIEQNGDLVVKFYKEQVLVQPLYSGNITISNNNFGNRMYNSPGIYTFNVNNPFVGTTNSGYNNGTGNINTLNLKSGSSGSNTTLSRGIVGASSFTSSVDFAPDAPENKERSCYFSSTDIPVTDCLGMMGMEQSRGIVDMSSNFNQKKRSMSKSIPSEEIETGRVEKGSSSDQLFKGNYSKFESSYSWISEWKILPESRKEVTIDDLVEYCTKCGRKRKKNEIYCPKDGTKF